MRIGVVGLGLIGGSLIKAIKKYTNHEVYGYNRSKDVLKTALSEKTIDFIGTDSDLKNLDILIISLYPEATIEFLKNKSGLISENTIITDCCGIKRTVCDGAFDIAHKSNLIFIGGHPMAGIEKSGYSNSFAELFINASFILTPPDKAKQIDHDYFDACEKLKNLALEIKFANVVITTPETHDKVIAYTSQLAHVVSSAYVKASEANRHKGFSAGSFKDMTRVAKLNEDMWTELFFDNADYLAKEIDDLINRLTLYSNALKNSDTELMKKLLKEGREIKEAVE